MLYKLDNWNFCKNIPDNRKCYNTNIYSGNSLNMFLKKVRENFNNFGNFSKNFSNKQNLFEYLLTNECKLFFDIDKVKINLKNDFGFKQDLNNFLDCVDEAIGKKLNRRKYLIFYKNTNTDITYSLRIINFEYKISISQSKKLLILLKEKYSNPLVVGLDDIYNYNRQICLPYNSKPYSIKYNDKIFDNHFKPEESINHFFMYYDFNSLNYNIKNYIKEYCVSCTQDCKDLNFSSELLGKIDLLKTKDYIIGRTPYYLQQSKYTIIDVVKEFVKNEFYSKSFSRLWCNFVYYFKCLDIDVNTIYSFLKYSAEMSGNQYNYECNIAFYKNININSFKCYDYIYKILAENLNKLNDTHYFYINYKEESFKMIAEWIVSSTDLVDYELVSEQFAKYKSVDKLEIIKINDTICYNYKTGNLHIHNERFCKNYFIDQHKDQYKLKEKYNLKESADFDMVIDNINDINFKQVIEDFKNNKIKNLVVEMDWGGGKSKFIEKPIIQHFCNRESNKKVALSLINKNNFSNYLGEIKRIIAFSPNNSLNKKEYSELLQIENNCFVNHLTLKELVDKINKLEKKLIDSADFIALNEELEQLKSLKNIYAKNLNVMTSLESANRIDTSEYSNRIGLVIYDEFNSLFTKFNENMETFKHINPESAFNKFVSISKQAKQRLILDADIDKQKLKFFCEVSNINPASLYTVRINGNIFKEHQIYMCENKKHLTEEIIKNLDKKLVISTTSSTHGYYMFKLIISQMYSTELKLKEQYKDEVIGYIFGDGLYIYNCKNPEQSIIDKKIEKYESESESENCIFKEILHKHSVILKQSINIKKYKNEFLDKCEEQIITEYKITKYIRSPTISVGVSINERYFDLQFNYVLNGSVGCLEALQMWFRERRTNLREIYFCFGNYLTNYNKNLTNSDNIVKRYKNNYRIVNTDLRKLINYSENFIEFDEISFWNTSSNFYKWKLINEIDKENDKTNFPQIFMELLNKHGLNGIKVLNSKFEKIDLIDSVKNDNANVELHNLLTTNIKDITFKDFELLSAKKEDNILTNKEYLLHRKYNLFNHYLYYDAYILNKIFKEERYNLISMLEDKMKENDCTCTIQSTNYDKYIRILKDTQLVTSIVDYNTELINKYIETETHYKKYKLHEYKTDFKSKYFRLLKLINYNENFDEIEETDNQNLEYIATNKLIFWMLKFLDINILKDFNKDILKHYIVNSNSKKNFVEPINKVLHNKIKIDNKEIKFIEFINKELLLDYNNCSNLKKHKAINIKQLDAKTHLLEILTIIKFYLSKVNLTIDYGSNIHHQSKLLKSLQFTIRKEYNISTKQYKIPKYILHNKNLVKDNVEIYEKQVNYKFHTIMKKIIDEEFVKSNKTYNNCVMEAKKNPVVIVQLKLVDNQVKVCISPRIEIPENKYIENENCIENKDEITVKTIYSGTDEEFVIEDVYGNKVINKPVKNIKRKNKDKCYYYNDIKLNSELYTSYPVNTKKEIINHLESIKPNIMNFATLINQKVKAHKIQEECAKVKVYANLNIENGRVKLDLFPKIEPQKRRRYTADTYDTDKRNKLLNIINIEIKQPVKKLNDDALLVSKIKYDNVMRELMNKSVEPILVKNRMDYFYKFLDNIVETY